MKKFNLIGIYLSIAFALHAEVIPNPLIGEGMVLEQQSTVRFWGSASPNEKVTVTFRGKSASATADDTGHWSIPLPSQQAGGPFPLTVNGTNSISLSNVYVGEVWLCSGQSNMELGLARTTGGAEASASSTNPLLHFFVVPHIGAETPQESVPGKWVDSSPQVTKNLSAVSYWFGSKLQKDLGVPVGIIVAPWSGTNIEAWLSRDSLARYLTQDPGSDYLKEKEAYDAQVANFAPLKEKYDQDVAAAKQAGLPPPPAHRFPGPFRGPSIIYNGMIVPMKDYASKGIEW